MKFFVRGVVMCWVVMQMLFALPVFAQGTGAPTTPPTRSSNTQGTAARPTTAAAVQATSDSDALGGVYDPFGGRSIQVIIGGVVQFLLGAAGALFLAMFVYGGAVWLTAGSSDRHEQAKKTLLNASAGVLIVIGSYTMIALLIRFVGGLGVPQSNVEAVEETPATQEGASAPTPTPTTVSEGAPTGCDAGRFGDACAASCVSSGAGPLCAGLCPNIYLGVCPEGSTPLPATPEGRMTALTACQSLCSTSCRNTLLEIDRTPAGTAARSAFVSLGCNSACPTWCRAAFEETRAVGR